MSVRKRSLGIAVAGLLLASGGVAYAALNKDDPTPEPIPAASPSPTHDHNDGTHSHDEGEEGHSHDIDGGTFGNGYGEVEHWQIRVVETNPDAAAQVAQANPVNPDPKGHYVLVTVEGKNTSEQVDDLQFLRAQLQGSNLVVYGQGTAQTPYEVAGTPTAAAPGGTVSAQYLFDVPAEALGPGTTLLLGWSDEKFPLIVV